MRKNIVFIFSIAVILLASCRKTGLDSVFGETSDERLRKVLTADSTALVGSAYGWKAVLSPGSGVGAYFFYFKFNDKGYVSMVSDFNTTTASKPDTGTWRLKAIQSPSLIFDTYSYIHLLSDPDAGVNGGTTGKGLYSDFEFSFNEMTVSDSMTFTGNVNKSSLVLVKATEEEQNAYLGGALNTLITTASTYVSNNPYLYIQFPNGDKLPFGLSVTKKQVVIQYVDNNTVTNLSSTFYFTQNSLHLKTPITYKTYTFEDVYWDETNKVFYIIINGTRIDVTAGTTALTLAITPELYNQLVVKYTDIYVNPTTQAGLPASFKTLWAQVVTKVAAVGNAGRVPEYFDVLFPTKTQMQIKCRYHNTAGTVYNAVYTFVMSIDANGVATFTYSTADSNGSVVKTGFQPLIDFMVAHKFTFGYVANTSSTTLLGGLFATDSPASFYFGELK